MRFVLILGLWAFSQWTVAAVHHIEVYQNRLVPETVVVSVGDQVTWTVITGQHRIEAQNNAQVVQFSSPLLRPEDQYSLVIDEVFTESLYHSAADEQLLGALVMDQASNDYLIDERVNASYYNPATPGQGMLFEYVPSTNMLLVYWFTYNQQNGQQQWLLASGSVNGNQAVLTVYESTGGRFADATTPTNQVWGEMTVIMQDCLQGRVHYNARDEQHAGQIPIVRLYAAEVCAAGGDDD